MTTRCRYLFTIVVVFLGSLSVYSRTLFCREPGIKGKHANASRAHTFLPPNTSDMSKAVIYVENTPDGFYFHSNFVTPGSPNPTKALIDEKIAFRTLFVNMIYGRDFNEREQSTALAAYKQQARIL